jgi:hypothetical protein
VSPAASPASSQSSSATPLTGTQLSGILLPASSLPTGFKEDPSATQDSGSAQPSDTAAPMTGSQVCDVFAQTGFIRAGGITAGDFAQSDYVTADKNQEIALEIDAFTGTDAQQVMTTLWQELGKCSSFTYTNNGTKVSNTLTRSRLAGVGDDAFKAVDMSPVYSGGETVVAVRVGSQIITTVYSSSGNDVGSAAVGYAEQIAQRLKAAG